MLVPMRAVDANETPRSNDRAVGQDRTMAGRPTHGAHSDRIEHEVPPLLDPIGSTQVGCSLRSPRGLRVIVDLILDLSLGITRFVLHLFDALLER